MKYNHEASLNDIQLKKFRPPKFKWSNGKKNQKEAFTTKLTSNSFG